VHDIDDRRHQRLVPARDDLHRFDDAFPVVLAEKEHLIAVGILKFRRMYEMDSSER
jgi:hypothetical protein